MGLLDGAKNAISGAGQILGKQMGLIKQSDSDDDFSNPTELMACTNTDSVSYLTDTFYRWGALSSADMISRRSYDFVIWRVEADGQPKLLSKMPMYIPPTSISMDTTPAATLFATMKGMVEDQNGAPFRPIVISGTSAVYFEEHTLPDDESDAAKEIASTVSYVFGNTINQAKSVMGNVNKLVSSLSGQVKVPPDDPPINVNIEEKDGVGTNGFVSKYSGYRYFHALSRFFDMYLALKKQQSGSNIRLTFQMHKDKMYFDCILNKFNFVKPPGSLEYQFNIQLTSYRRRPEPIGGDGNIAYPKPLKPPYMSFFAKIVNAMTLATLTVASASDLLITAKNDVYGAFLKPAQKALMLAKSVVGFAQTLDTVYNEAKTGAGFKAAWKQLQAESNAIKKAAGKTGTLGIIYNIANYQDTVTVENNGKADATPSNEPDASPLNPESLSLSLVAGMASEVNVEEFNKYPAAAAEIKSIIDDATSMTLEDLKNSKKQMESTANEIAKSLGGGSATFDKQMGIDDSIADTVKVGTAFDQEAVLDAIGAVPASEITPVPLSVENIEILSALNDCLMAMDSIIVAFQDADPDAKIDYASAYKNMAVANDIQFNDYSSKFYVPFPYGATLQSFAVQYLGSADKWIEVAAINGLQPPYVDEEGFEKTLMSSGAGSSLLVANRDNLFIGQSIEIYSESVAREVRVIEKIDVVSSIETLLYVSGTPDLSKYRVQDNARIKAYLPNTVNSQKLIAIPSKVPATVRQKFKNAPNMSDLGFIGEIALVDFLLQSDGDLIIEGNDIKLATGYSNLVQAAVIKLKTRQNSLIHDPSFGNPIQVGTSVSDIDLKTQITALSSLFTSDSRFNGIGATNISLSGPTVSLNVLVGVKDSDIYIPLTTEVPK